MAQKQVVITGTDIVTSVARALQYISVYHPADYIRALTEAYRREQSEPARRAMAQILANSRLAAFGRRPICQDTGMVVVFAKIGMNVRIASDVSLLDLVNEGVRRAYLDPVNPLRASIVAEPLSGWRNTGDNTPAVVHAELVPGDTITLSIAAKGGGSENKARFTTLYPGDSVEEWVVRTVETLGAGWCPPGVMSVGIGGSAEKAMLLAKDALNQPVDMAQLLARSPASAEEELRVALYRRINDLGIGAQGMGGMTSVVDVKVATYPTHAASKPVALMPQCAANRHITITLDGHGPCDLKPPVLEDWPRIEMADTVQNTVRRVDLDRLDRDETARWRAGETLLLSGRLLTGRDAAHKRLAVLMAEGADLPVELAGRALYYVGPVRAAPGEIVGPAGPTTSRRMDGFLEPMLQAGLLATIGKAERSAAAIEAIRQHRAPYLAAVGGAGYLISRAIEAARVVAFPDLGMEAIHELTVRDMPVIVAVDADGHAIHQTGPAAWRR